VSPKQTIPLKRTETPSYKITPKYITKPKVESKSPKSPKSPGETTPKLYQSKSVKKLSIQNLDTQGSPLTNRLKRSELIKKDKETGEHSTEDNSSQSQHDNNQHDSDSSSKRSEDVSEKTVKINRLSSSLTKPKPLRKNGQFSPSPFDETQSTNGNIEKKYSTYKEFIQDSNTEPSEEYALPILTKEGYETRPSLSVLSQMPPQQLKSIENFAIEKKGIGFVEFPGYTNVMGLDLDSIIDFYPREMIAYPDVSKKPPIGSGLNKKAIITLYGCRPRKEKEEYYEKFEEKLKLKTIEGGGKFLGYTRENGAWSFEVDHF